MVFYSLMRPLIFSLSPEKAHHVALGLLKRGLLLPARNVSRDSLKTECFGLTFNNPIGLAAGFDKNAEATKGLQKQGFGFLELGTVTPEGQPGNPQPRMFRLKHNEAVINRLGFNNEGLDAFCQNLRTRPCKLPFGANIGKNKTSTSAMGDYMRGLHEVYTYADYITLNISSPNTQGLRDLQQKQELDILLEAMMRQRNELADLYHRKVPILLKIAPDFTGKDAQANQQQKQDIAEAVLEHQLDGLIVSNTTVKRPKSLKGKDKNQQGGLSGKPLMKPSTALLAEMYQLTQGEIPLIGVGGVASAADAYAKIRAGATLVQLYSALVYQGFGLVNKINRGLAELLAKDGYSHISEAVGVDAKR